MKKMMLLLCAVPLILSSCAAQDKVDTGVEAQGVKSSPAVKEIKDEYPDYQVEYLEGKCSPEEAAVYKADDAELKNEIMTLYNEVVGESEKLGEGSFVELDGGYAPILRITDKDGNETQFNLITVSEGRTSDECLINVIYTGSNSDQCEKQAYRCGGETYDKLYDVLYGHIKAQEKSNVKYIIQNPESVEYVQVPVTEENSKEMEKLVNAFMDSSVPNEAYSFSKSLPDAEAPVLGMPLMLERYEDGVETMKIALFLYDYCVDGQDFQSGEYVVFYPDEDMVKGFDCPKEEYSALCMAIKNEIG